MPSLEDALFRQTELDIVLTVEDYDVGEVVLKQVDGDRRVELTRTELRELRNDGKIERIEAPESKGGG